MTEPEKIYVVMESGATPPAAASVDRATAEKMCASFNIKDEDGISYEVVEISTENNEKEISGYSVFTCYADMSGEIYNICRNYETHISKAWSGVYKEDDYYYFDVVAKNMAEATAIAEKVDILGSAKE